MAFMKLATARVVKPNIGIRGWSRTRTASTKMKTASNNLVSQASSILGETFDPDKYLLTHCTIVASVEVENAPGVKVGRFRKGSKQILRKYTDYLVSPESSQFVNSNGDCWSRETLLKSFPTFIGAQNFQEHVQIEEKSKGRIIDAVARDVGNAIYIDILVATNRKHVQLVADIESGRMNSLSMGCTIEFTICTRCGNVAVDETDLCDHIKYHKLDTFYDSSGKRRIIAELCGHSSVGETGGVTFIEASWVENPAFKGAVVRTLLNSGQLSDSVQRQAKEIFEKPSDWFVDTRYLQKAAAFDDFDDEEEGSSEEGDDKSPLEELETDIEQAVIDNVDSKIRKELQQQQLTEAIQPSAMTPNDNLNKEANLKKAYEKASKVLIRKASSPPDLINKLAELDQAFGQQVPRTLYRVTLKVGASNRYSTFGQYLKACSQELGRSFTPREAKTIRRLGLSLTALEHSK